MKEPLIGRRTMLKSVSAVGGSVAIAGCSSDTEYEDGGDSDSDGESGGKSDSQLKIVDHEWYTEEYSAGVRGTAENVAGDNLSYISVKVKFYDSDDALIDSSLDNINDLGADEKWKFDVMYLDTDYEKLDSYKIGVGEGF